MKKKIISLACAVILVLGTFAPVSVLATNENNEQVHISATTDQTIKIEESNGVIEDDYNGILELIGGEFSIQRDYSQYGIIKVKNNASYSVEYYLTVSNPYDDIFLNFVRSGSADIPLVIDAGETQEIRLDIFAQNAKETNYEIPVYANLVGNYDENERISKSTVLIKIPQVVTNFELKEKAENPNSLEKQFILTNLGEAVTDVEVFAKGDLANYLSFSPAISNYSMGKNATKEFAISPDLTMMKNNGISKLEGKIVVSAGSTSKEFSVLFDTKGQEIKHLTVSELVALQNKGSTTGLTTNSSGNGATETNVSGGQCTNAGKITHKWVIDGLDVTKNKSVETNAISKEDLELYVTSRMYGGSYVDKTTTNYDYYLNGKKVARTTNTGLTELSIAKLPTDNLIIGGENTLIRDYDTNPGSHFVTAETRITLIIPGDAIVSYIGEPVGLKDLRSLPDLAIYPENIYTSGERVYIGEENAINMNVYNRGSEAGEYKITVSDGTNVVYSSENNNISAFSGETISFNWTPQSASTKLSVTITNTTPGMEEKYKDNNSASVTINAVERKAPIITNIADVAIRSGKEIVLSADVVNTENVKKVEFFINDELVDGKISMQNRVNAIRYSIAVNKNYEIGSYNLKAVVTYADSNTTEKTIEKAAQLTILDKDWRVPTVTIDLPKYSTYKKSFNVNAYLSNADDVVGVKFMVDDSVKFIGNQDDFETYSITLTSLDVGEHTIKAVVTYMINNNEETAELSSESKTISVLSEQESSFVCTLPVELISDLDASVYCFYGEDNYSHDYVYISDIQTTDSQATIKIPYSDFMVENKENGYICFSSDNAFISIPLKNSGITLNKADLKNVKFVGDSVRMQRVIIRKMNEKNVYESIYSYQKTFYFVPGVYDIDVGYSISGNYSYKQIHLDLTQSDQTIDLMSDCRYFRFCFEEATEYIDNVFVKCKDNDGYWNTLDGSLMYEDDVYSYYTTYANDADVVDNSKETKLYVTTADSMYCANVTDLSQITVLKKSDLKKVSINVEDKDSMSISGVYVYGNEQSVYFESSEIYLTEGEYDFKINCVYSKKKMLAKNLHIAVNEDTTIEIKNEFVNLTFTWSNAFNSVAYVSTYSDKTYIDDQKILQDGKLLLEKDKYSGNIRLQRNSGQYEVMFEADCSETEKTVQFNNLFSGSVYMYDSDETFRGTSHVSIALSDLKDKNGNELSYFRCYDSEDTLNGYVRLKNINNATEIIDIPVSIYYLSDYESIRFELPNVTGEYSIEVELETGSNLIHDEFITPDVYVYYDNNSIYSCGKLPELYLSSDSTEGTVKWDSTELKEGTNEYKWTFTPSDTETYKTITGKETISVKEGHCWSQWISDNNAKFIVEGTMNRTCLVCGKVEKAVDEGSAGYHEYLLGGKKSGITIAIITALATTLTWLIIHWNFWWIIGI